MDSIEYVLIDKCPINFTLDMRIFIHGIYVYIYIYRQMSLIEKAIEYAAS